MLFCVCISMCCFVCSVYMYVLFCVCVIGEGGRYVILEAGPFFMTLGNLKMIITWEVEWEKLCSSLLK